MTDGTPSPAGGCSTAVGGGSLAGAGGFSCRRVEDDAEPVARRLRVAGGVPVDVIVSQLVEVSSPSVMPKPPARIRFIIRSLPWD